MGSICNKYSIPSTESDALHRFGPKQTIWDKSYHYLFYWWQNWDLESWHYVSEVMTLARGRAIYIQANFTLNA